jgi:branched-chain amino acid transport system ATP-binding protein
MKPIPKPLLQVRKLDAFYGDFQALFAIDFDVAEGEAVAVIGANGAGKSTFLKTIAGLLPAPTHAIRFAGTPIGGKGAPQIVALGVAMVPEGRRLFPSLTVEENLLIGSYTGRAGPWSLKTIYELFPILAEKRQQPGTELSGGQQQMVAIGRALMANPRLLLCDEISLGLAPKVVRELYQLLPRIRAHGTAIILVEQNIQQALADTDRFYCFREGLVSLCGRSDNVTREAISAAYFGL